MQEEDIDYAVGGLASIVRDLCDASDRLEKDDFVRLAKATATVLLASSACDAVMVDVRSDELATENAVVIHELWRKSGLEQEFRKFQASTRDL